MVKISLTVSLEDELIEELDEMAERDGISRATIIRNLVKKGLRVFKRQISLVVDQETLDEVEKLAKLRSVSRAEILRRLVSKGLEIDVREHPLVPVDFSKPS